MLIVPEPKLRKPCRVAINPLDLSQLSPTIWGPVLKGRVAFGKMTLEHVDKNRPDEIAAVFTCPVLEAALALDKFLSETRAINEAAGTKDVYRCYIHRGLTWVKLRQDAVMTLWDEHAETWTLNPDVFPLVDEGVRPDELQAARPKENSLDLFFK